jgi:c-di-GMP-binding flagellar brake protein YcgR
VLTNIIDILKLPNPNTILLHPDAFEKAVGKMLTFMKQRNEDEESFFNICKDLTITYEKLYHPARVRKPLESLTEIDINQLLYFVTEDGDIFFGKVAGIGNNALSIKLFRAKKELQSLAETSRIKVYIWRVGDAEYTFNTESIQLSDNILTIKLPREFTRDQEFRHPYLDVIIPCKVTRVRDNPVEEAETVQGTIYKINDYESVIRLAEKQDYNHHYTLEFTINDFNFSIISKIIANRTILEENIYYFTMKFEDISDAARNVLKNYIYEHL